MKILLINPIFHDNQSVFTDTVYPPIGLLQVASAMRKKISQNSVGIVADIKLLDGQIMSETEVYEQFRKFDPDIVGFSVMIGQPLKSAMVMSHVIHQVTPKTKIIWGGPVSRITPYFIPDFVETDDKYYDNAPAWDLLESVSKYEHAIFTSRGCCWKCNFCYHRKDDNVKFESVQEVIGQMEYLHRNFGWKYFKIMDDNFFTNTTRAILIMDEMKKRGYKIKQAHSHANSFTNELVDYLDHTIINAIGISIEHGDQRIVDNLNKKLNITHTLKVIKKLGDKKIRTIHNFIFGLPYGQDDTHNFARMRQIKALSALSRGVGFTYAPMPETPLIGQIEGQYGEYPKDYEFWEDFNMAVIDIKYNKWLTKEQIQITQRMANDFNKEFNIKPGV